jgi:hypothetical protein
MADGWNLLPKGDSVSQENAVKDDAAPDGARVVEVTDILDPQFEYQGPLLEDEDHVRRELAEFERALRRQWRISDEVFVEAPKKLEALIQCPNTQPMTRIAAMKCLMAMHGQNRNLLPSRVMVQAGQINILKPNLPDNGRKPVNAQ